MFCVKCGHQLKNIYKFCPKCGAKQPNVAVQHLPTDDRERRLQVARDMSQSEISANNSNSTGVIRASLPGVSVSVRYRLNGTTETKKLSLPCIIGRSSEWPLLLADEKASQQHAKVYLENSSVMIEDLCSMNGTFVNGEKIRGPVELLSGDEVKIGMTNLYFVVSAEN